MLVIYVFKIFRHFSLQTFNVYAANYEVSIADLNYIINIIIYEQSHMQNYYPFLRPLLKEHGYL